MHAILEQLADVVTAVKVVTRSVLPAEAEARRRMDAAVRPMVFAGNCLWAAADGWQEHEALVDLQRYGASALERVVRMRDGAGEALDAAALFRTEHALRALVATVIDGVETSAASTAAAQGQKPHQSDKNASR